MGLKSPSFILRILQAQEELGHFLQRRESLSKAVRLARHRAGLGTRLCYITGWPVAVLDSLVLLPEASPFSLPPTSQQFFELCKNMRGYEAVFATRLALVLCVVLRVKRTYR